MYYYQPMSENFFDYNSTTPVCKEALEAMLPYFSECFANPSAQTSAMSLKSKAAIDRAQEEVADFIGCKSHEIVFTSGATESINWVFEEFLSLKKNVLVSEIDHDASYEKVQSAQNSLAIFFKANKLGQVDLESFKKACTRAKPKSLVNLMYAHNELGTLLNLKELISIAKEHSLFVHIDATQALGKTPFSFKNSEADFLSCSAHKFYGPKGVGTLVINSKTASLTSLIKGGGQQNNLRSGTLNTPLIVGFGAAAKLAKESLQKDMTHYESLKNLFFDQIKGLNYNLNSDNENSLKNTINITFNDWNSPSPLYLELTPFAVSQGSACSSGSGASRVLSSIGQHKLSSTIRISFGRGSKAENTTLLAKRILSLLSK